MLVSTVGEVLASGTEATVASTGSSPFMTACAGAVSVGSFITRFSPLCPAQLDISIASPRSSVTLVLMVVTVPSALFLTTVAKKLSCRSRRVCYSYSNTQSGISAGPPGLPGRTLCVAKPSNAHTQAQSDHCGYPLFTFVIQSSAAPIVESTGSVVEAYPPGTNLSAVFGINWNKPLAVYLKPVTGWG